jgi:hypothetical protein
MTTKLWMVVVAMLAAVLGMRLCMAIDSSSNVHSQIGRCCQVISREATVDVYDPEELSRARHND